MKMHLNNIINQFEATDAETHDSETFQENPIAQCRGHLY
jgi:hypothetical protein